MECNYFYVLMNNLIDITKCYYPYDYDLICDCYARWHWFIKWNKRVNYVHKYQ